ncbi:MAG: DNA methyltransferase, partial [Candidatus Thorarchaeota archaeon]
QNLNKNYLNQKSLRERSAAFPLEIPYRLINMFSIYGDIILDPFWGTGTTSLAAMSTTRNSIGYELNPEFMKIFKENIKKIIQFNFDMNNNRLKNHVNFINKYRKRVKDIKYKSIHYEFPVVTKQEMNILLYSIKNYNENRKEFIVNYEKFQFKVNRF